MKNQLLNGSKSWGAYIFKGVIRTRVGYAGGSTEKPTYRNLADHIETIQLDYDAAKIGYQDLLNIFFNNHKPIAERW